jgi:hypothetical protein
LFRYLDPAGLRASFRAARTPPPAPMSEAPTPAPVAPAVSSAELLTARVDDHQLDLLSWKRPAPKPLPLQGTQLWLFGETDM